MAPIRKSGIGICVMAMILLTPALLIYATPDDPANAIELSGIPGPYSFERVCKLLSGDLWLVGGDGKAYYHSAKRGSREIRLVEQEQDLNGVFFVNAQRGWIVGEGGIIVNTRDAGFTWTYQKSGVTTRLQAITCTDENRCWTIGDQATILATHDGGDHWHKLRSDFSVRLFAVDFVNNRTGWVVGEDGFFARTKDGGKTWEKGHVPIILFPDGPYASPTDLLAVRFTDELHGWVAGAGGIARTVDAGRTWEVKEVEGNAFIGLVSHNGKTLWAVSREGTNYFTDDAGLIWRPVKYERTSAKQYHTN